ncbi:DUF5996 family protein [Nocardia sp. NPDC057227]|uniref:DUF5996 family protein n=1 Tax=Nocardia sp. NPDC057227 TaxID=3346056 RepID=UPI0036292F7E
MSGNWPRLRVAEWTDTRDTLHMWTQIVGKIRMAHAPLVNHWWEVALYVSPRGLTTSAIPYADGVFDLEFDFVEHRLLARTSAGESRAVALEPKSVADFYAEVTDALGALRVPATIRPVPNEVQVAIPFDQDTVHASYDGAAVQRFWQQLIQVDRVFGIYRSRFVGKSSPVHFFWGAMDLACTRFSGRTAPPHPGGAPNCADWVMLEGYSQELASCGFWPGGGEEGAFYAYAYPEPPGYPEHPIGPGTAEYRRDLGEFVLPYEAVAESADPDRTLLEFLDSSYAAAATLADWDRGFLEDDPQRLRRHLG